MEPNLQAFCFLIILICSPTSRTFQILFGAALTNMVFYWVTTEETAGLLIAYSLLDTLTAFAILTYGDRLKVFQVLLLITALVIHFILQIDIIFGSSIVYDLYLVLGASITVLQMLGAVIDGSFRVDKGIWRAFLDWCEYTAYPSKTPPVD